MDTQTKQTLIELADAHERADEYKSGFYEWHNGACSIGCTIHDAIKIGLLAEVTYAGDHAKLAVALNVPELVWRLADYVFEGMKPEDRPGWTPRLLRAIRPDADYSNLADRLNARLTEKLAGDAIRPDVAEASRVLAMLYRRRAAGEQIVNAEWNAAWQQANAAKQQAEAAWRQANATGRQERQAYAAWQQANAAEWQEEAEQQTDAAERQAEAGEQQAYAAEWQANALRRQQWWAWCGDMLCEELAR